MSEHLGLIETEGHSLIQLLPHNKPALFHPHLSEKKRGKKYSFQRETGNGSDPFITNCSALPLYPRLEKFCQQCPVTLVLKATVGMPEVLAAGLVLSQVLELITAPAVWQTEQTIRRSAGKRTPLLCLPRPPLNVLPFPRSTSSHLRFIQG